MKQAVLCLVYLWSLWRVSYLISRVIVLCQLRLFTDQSRLAWRAKGKIGGVGLLYSSAAWGNDAAQVGRSGWGFLLDGQRWMKDARCKCGVTGAVLFGIAVLFQVFLQQGRRVSLVVQ